MKKLTTNCSLVIAVMVERREEDFELDQCIALEVSVDTHYYLTEHLLWFDFGLVCQKSSFFEARAHNPA